MRPQLIVIIQRLLAHGDPRFILHGPVEPLLEVEEESVGPRALEGSPVDVTILVLEEAFRRVAARLHRRGLLAPLYAGLRLEVGVVREEGAADLGEEVAGSAELHGPLTREVRVMAGAFNAGQMRLGISATVDSPSQLQEGPKLTVILFLP